MPIFYGKELLTAYFTSKNSPNLTIGFVPTMGALHRGHLSLMEESLANNDLTVVSIFVNPTQFNNPDDLKKYPRTLESDIEKIENLNKEIIVYAPAVEDLYDGNPQSESYDFDGLENQMEGKFRPGHFDGVGTVVKKLFETVKPINAYFGEKDFQQLQIIKKLVAKQKLNINVVGCPIFRESNQLAMSSRNALLSDAEKDKASIIYKTLIVSKILFKTESADFIRKKIENDFKKNSDFKLDYFEIADEKTLLPCFRKMKNKKYRAFIAVFINNVRLIDTISLN